MYYWLILIFLILLFVSQNTPVEKWTTAWGVTRGNPGERANLYRKYAKYMANLTTDFHRDMDQHPYDYQLLKCPPGWFPMPPDRTGTYRMYEGSSLINPWCAPFDLPLR